MASSSGGEGSEEEYDADETSPSYREITAASQRPLRHTNKKKKLRYLQDYLQRLPKHQRRRIQKEIDKEYKPGESAAIYFLPTSKIYHNNNILGHTNLIVSFSSPPASVSTYRFCLHYCLETPATPLFLLIIWAVPGNHTLKMP